MTDKGKVYTPVIDKSYMKEEINMTKTQIFEDVVRVMQQDASCCKDEHGADVSVYRARITDDMDNESFIYVMQSYLATFHVRSHVSFCGEARGKLAFAVRRYQNALYVYEAADASALRVGDKIVRIDGVSVDAFAQSHSELLYDEPEERQSYCWFSLLSFAKKVTAVKADSGEVITYPITLVDEWVSGARYACKRLRENVAYMRLKDFSDEQALMKLYEENDALLRSCVYLVIDVRDNRGGSDTAYLPLFAFCLPCGARVSELPDDIFDSGSEINYTVRNCDIRLHMLEEYLQMDVPDETRALISQMVDTLKQNRGKGFVREEDFDTESLPYVGLALPKKVYIITDENCASSGDSFVNNMRKSSKVTVVGRPTMGILDFSNCASLNYGDILFFYPTSRAMYLDNGVQMRGRGVPVDIAVPWTPEHLKRDVDLDTVLALIEKDA